MTSLPAGGVPRVACEISGSQDRIVNQEMRPAAVQFLTAPNPHRQSEETPKLVLNKIIDSGTL